MKNKIEKDYYESRDTWWSIQEQIENDADQNTVQKLNHIMELSLYNQRDMLIEIDNLKSEIIAQKRPQLKKQLRNQKKRGKIYRQSNFGKSGLLPIQIEKLNLTNAKFHKTFKKSENQIESFRA